MNCRKLSIVVPLCGMAIGSYSTVQANVALQPSYDQKTLAQVEALYGLNEDGAVTRLAKEYDAAVQARFIEEHNLPGYAGAWFDQGTQSLHVATSQTADFTAIEDAGAVPTLVAHSLKDLETTRAGFTNALESSVGVGAVRESYVDVQSNAIVFGITGEAMPQASALVAVHYASAPIQLISVAKSDSGFSSDLHGADPTRNGAWPLLPDGTRSPCSVGASAEKIVGSTYTAGYATAGHCGTLGNAIVANNGTTALGTVRQSTYDFASGTETNNQDGGWVETVSPWIPKPQVNGYTDGILNVSGTWSGMLIAPVGTTVCRYGEKSGGPYCGTVSQLNATYSPTTLVTLHGMIKVHGTCTEDGDSGGPLVMPANQIQGTDTGSDNLHSC